MNGLSKSPLATRAAGPRPAKGLRDLVRATASDGPWRARHVLLAGRPRSRRAGLRIARSSPGALDAGRERLVPDRATRQLQLLLLAPPLEVVAVGVELVHR